MKPKYKTQRLEKNTQTKYGTEEDVPVRFDILEPAHNKLNWFPKYLCITSPLYKENPLYGSTIVREEKPGCMYVSDYAEEHGIDPTMLANVMKHEDAKHRHVMYCARELIEKNWAKYKPKEGYTTQNKWFIEGGISSRAYASVIAEGEKPPHTMQWLETTTILYDTKDIPRFKSAIAARQEKIKQEKHLANKIHAERNKAKGFKGVKRGRKRAGETNKTDQLIPSEDL